MVGRVTGTTTNHALPMIELPVPVLHDGNAVYADLTPLLGGEVNETKDHWLDVLVHAFQKKVAATWLVLRHATAAGAAGQTRLAVPYRMFAKGRR